MLIDSHCHLDQLDLTTFDNSLENVFLHAKENGVTHFLNVCIDKNNFPAVLKIAKSYGNVWASVGIHPNEPVEEDIDEEQLFGLAQDEKVIAIGETGLDYYRSGPELAWQQERFRRHVRVAKALKKPLIIHSRNAEQDTLAILREEKAQEVGGVLHCFTGSQDMALAAIDLGFYISFSGIITFKNAEDLQRVARNIPLSSLLVETDAPYLAPVPFRGKQNYPGYVKHVALALADLKSCDFLDMAKATTMNFLKLFSVTL